MKQVNLTSILIIIILSLLVYLAFFKSGNDEKYTDLIDQQNQGITLKIEALKDLIIQKTDSIKIIEKKNNLL